MEKIKRKLDELEEYTEILSMVSTYSKEDFMNNPIYYGGAERFILLGYHNILEASKLICEHCRFSNIHSKDIIKSLEINKVIPPWLVSNINKRKKYIFTLKYDYLRLMNKEELYFLLKDIISDFRHFKKYVLEYII
ncbi:MAG: hypothetical protein AB1420_11860 [Bacillota bacterium]